MKRIQAVLFLLISLVTGCSVHPGVIDEAALRDGARASEQGPVSMAVRVIADDEAREMFGAPLGVHGIQAVWLEVVNGTGASLYYLPVTTDPTYFSPLEVSWKVRGGFSKTAKRELDAMFFAAAMPVEIPAGETVSGFIFTNRDLGVKVVNVDLLGSDSIWQASFLLDVPGIKLDVEKVDFTDLYEEHEYQQLDRQGLRDWLAEQPCCTRNAAGDKEGDPVNFVVVGQGQLLLSAFVQRDWDLTERIHGGSIWKTMQSFLLGSSYRYSPVSSLFVFERPQDLALQKARGNIHQRNHFRLWRAPVNCDGEPVWLGQISRDIGVRFTRHSPTLTTHKIDPDVDEARDYLLQDMLFSQRLSEFGYVRAMPEKTITEPGHNLTGDPYISDGMRLVMFFHFPLTPVDKVRSLDWDRPDRDRRDLLEQAQDQAPAPAP